MMAINVKERPDLVELRGAFAKGPSGTLIFDHGGVRVLLDQRLVIINKDGSVSVPRKIAREKGLV